MTIQRPPIVSVLGHVDHGKTSLLDALRKTRVALREAGGITQSIGASVATTPDGKEITFIDTPGHAAFNSMRSRGAQASDVCVLVVAGDDGVKPQTKEALKFINEAQVPFVVAITKADLPNSNADIVLGQLEKEGVAFEGRGGNVPYLLVSAKDGQGLKELMEVIILLFEVGQTQSDPGGALQGVVIETNKDNRGLLVSTVVKNGTLTVGEEIYAGAEKTKVRGIFDWENKTQKKMLPGYPALILGFSNLPEVGSIVSSSPTDVSEKGAARVEGTGSEIKLSMVLKASSAGSLEAIIAGLPPQAQVLKSGVGDLTESDVLFAKDAKAIVFVFDAKVSSQVRSLLETEGVTTFEFKIIYELLDKVAEIVEKGTQKIIGKATILQSFPFDNTTVAGCKMVTGTINKTSTLVLARGDVQLGSIKIKTLKKQKDEVASVSQGEEFGVIFFPQLDFKVGDMLLSVVN